MITMEQQHGGPPNLVNMAQQGNHDGMMRNGELPTAYVTSTPLPMAKAQQLHHQQMMSHGARGAGGIMSEEETQKNAIISSLFEEIRLEATLFGDNNAQETTDEQPAPLPNPGANSGNKKLKKRKSELALEMTADDVDDILGDSTSSANFNPKNPFGPSPSGLSNGFADLGSPGSSSFSQKSSPPLSKYSQNNQGQRGSPPVQQNRPFAEMSPYMTTQMNSPLHSQLQSQTSMTSTPPPAVMHSPVPQVSEYKASMMPMGMGVPPNGISHLPHLPHHSRLLQHQQSAPNLRQGTFDDLPLPHTLGPAPTSRPFDRSLVEEFEMCVRAVLMASHRVCCRHVYRQLTAEVSELYARVAKNQVPKKAVKKIVGVRTPASHGERIELERQFKCLADGLESRQSSQLYESILHFLYKMRVAIPDST